MCNLRQARRFVGFCRSLLGGCLEHDRWKGVQRNSTMIEFKGSHFERDVILWGVRWYVAYPISYRQLEEMMEERGVTLHLNAIMGIHIFQ